MARLIDVQIPDHLFRELEQAVALYNEGAHGELVQGFKALAEIAQDERQRGELLRLIEHLIKPEVQEAIRVLSQPKIQETVQELGDFVATPAFSQAFGSAFARDWLSEEDEIYDELGAALVQ